MSDHLIFRNSQLFYEKTGGGNNVLLLFHGFGQQHQVFVKLCEALSTQYTIYSFDLFFHGKSAWNEGELPLEKEMWKEIISLFLKKHRIEKFSLLGYSLGAKFALTTFEVFPSQIEHIFLLAPDGIKTSNWYSLATYPSLLRQFFKSMILNPARLRMITSPLSALRLVDKGLLLVAESQMNTREKRERVYYSWVVFRHLQFDMRKIAHLIKSHSTKLTVIVSKDDKLIPVKNMNRLLRYLPNHHLEILDTGHKGIIENSIPVLQLSIRQ